MVVLLAANFGHIRALEAVAVPALPAKILAEIALLSVSYVLQQRYLFSGNAAEKATAEAARGAGRGQ